MHIACVDIPELPLQLLVRAHPDYRGAPVAVVAEERPEAPLLRINRVARELRLRTGMRFGAAKSLVPALRVGSVSAREVEEACTGLVRDLQTFSPHVERDPVQAGVFYVDPSGLEHLYGGELSWARCVHRYLSGRGFFSTVVVAHGRTLSYALCRVSRGARVIDSLEETLRLAHEVPLERLHVSPKLRDALERLGLSTLGDLSSFAVDALGTRFGREASAWCRVARGEETLPLCAEPHVDTPRVEMEIDPPDHDVSRLCFTLKRGLDRLLEDVRSRGMSVRALWMTLVLERGEDSVQRLEPSAPTRDAQLLLELLRLRLQALLLAAPVEAVVLEAQTTDAVQGQLGMFGPRRDLSAGERAIARLKAIFGADVVCRLYLEDAHLPEARFRWAEAGRLCFPQVEEAEERYVEAPLVRRLMPRPLPLRAELSLTDAGAKLVHGDDAMPLTGPYRVSGGWWVREVARDYYYACAANGELWWVFYDMKRDGWFLHGVVD
jgi:protein ImuB